MKKHSEDIKLNQNLISYFDGEIKEAERSSVENWMNESDENKAYFDKVKSVWNNNLSAEEQSEFDSQKAFKRFAEKYDYKSTEEKVTPKVRKLYARVIQVAAVFIIGFVLWQSGLFDDQTIKIETAELKEETVLPDNSSVFLNKNSQIAYSKKLKKKKIRKVQLEGEAFFDVEHNPEKPFIIYTHDVKIEVKGTSFNVCAYNDEPTVVTVKSGVVEVTPLINDDDEEDEPLVLYKDDKIEVDADSVSMVVEINDDPNYIAWTNDVYTFDSVAIKQVMQTLQEEYDTTIVVNNPAFYNCMLVAKFDSLNLDEIFFILQRTYNITVEKSNDTIYVDGKGCQ